MTAPVASGWSGCRVGLAPTGKRRLSTAHTRFGRGPGRDRFVERATEASNITPEVLPGGDPWRTWRGPPLGEMVLNL
jgi:hypothetical protein